MWQLSHNPFTKTHIEPQHIAIASNYRKQSPNKDFPKQKRDFIIKNLIFNHVGYQSKNIVSCMSQKMPPAKARFEEINQKVPGKVQWTFI